MGIFYKATRALQTETKAVLQSILTAVQTQPVLPTLDLPQDDLPTTGANWAEAALPAGTVRLHFKAKEDEFYLVAKAAQVAPTKNGVPYDKGVAEKKEIYLADGGYLYLKRVGGDDVTLTYSVHAVASS